MVQPQSEMASRRASTWPRNLISHKGIADRRTSLCYERRLVRMLDLRDNMVTRLVRTSRRPLTGQFGATTILFSAGYGGHRPC